jgi:undecaprenyl-diphosphatase
VQALLEAVVLGIIQGLTEFIPVSSSGHLVLSDHFLGLTVRSLAFDVALHLGTLAAVLVFFRAELLAIARGFLGGGTAGDRRLGLLFVVATVPVAVVGFTFRDVFERAFDSPVAAASFLYLTAALLVGSEQWRRARIRRGRTGLPRETTGLPATGEDPDDPSGLPLDGIRLHHAVIIGTGQCLALFPGVSRSGSTIAAGMAAGLTREAATRFSFMMSIPALVGAAILTLPDLGAGSADVGTGQVLAGVAAAFVAGYAAIRWLVALVARRGLYGFAAYCACVATLALSFLTL